MGLSNFPRAAERVLPVLVMNSVLSVTLLRNMVRSVFQVMSGSNDINSSDTEQEEEEEDPDRFSSPEAVSVPRERRISIARFKSLCQNRSCEAKKSTSNISADFEYTSTSISGCSTSSTNTSTECCVCLCGFEAEEEVSELSCKHFFHKSCLDKWFHNKHTSCPLCRSID